MSRRTKGAGTVFQRGNRWVAQIDLGISHDGRRMRQSRIAPTRKDVEKLLRTMLNERDLGLTRANDNLTFQQIRMEWYEIGSQSVKKSTADQYLWRLEKWVSKKPAANKVRDITPAMLMVELRRLEDTGLSASSVKGARAVMHSMLNHAVRTGRLTVNPMTAVRAPKSVPSKRKSSVNLTVDEAQRLYKVAFEHPEVTASTVILLGLKFGVRHGEILGLRLRDIDRDKGLLYMTQAAPPSSTRPSSRLGCSSSRNWTPSKRTARPRRRSKGRNTPPSKCVPAEWWTPSLRGNNQAV